MFSVDFPEIVIIFAVALIVLGPKKLPGAVAQIGRWVGRARAMARQFREQLEQEVNTVESALDVNKMDDRRRESGAAKASGSGSEPPVQPSETARSEPPFDAQLHDTALPPTHEAEVQGEPGGQRGPGQGEPGGHGEVGGHDSARGHDEAGAPGGGIPRASGEGVPLPASGAAPESDTTSAGMHAWMPENQTWMSGVAWEPRAAEEHEPVAARKESRAEPSERPVTARQFAATESATTESAATEYAATTSSASESMAGEHGGTR